MSRISFIFLLSLTGGAIGLCLVIVHPFLNALLFALTLGITFFPLHMRIQKVVGRANVAALASTLLVFLIIIVPVFVVGRTVTKELTSAYQTLSAKGPEGSGVTSRWLSEAAAWTNKAMHRAGLTQFDIRSAVREHAAQANGWLLRQATRFLSDLTNLLLGAMVTAVTLFVLFRDGRSLRERLATMIPLAKNQVEHLFAAVHDILVASVYGILAIGFLQGLLVGIAFWALGLPSPALWGIVTAFLSLVPVIGTGGVWVPASILLVVSGHWIKGLILVAWGAGVVGLVDNILRPYLVGQRTKLSTLYLFFAILGGVEVFGLIGVLVGPVVFSVAQALLEILRDELKKRGQPCSPQPDLNLEAPKLAKAGVPVSSQNVAGA